MYHVTLKHISFMDTPLCIGHYYSMIIMQKMLTEFEIPSFLYSKYGTGFVNL